MCRFSILIIEDHIAVTAAVTQIAGQYLEEYTLSIAKDVSELCLECHVSPRLVRNGFPVWQLSADSQPRHSA